ncbi:Ferric enterobactin esterase [Legionella beliardensis]|uniref:Ferric enterobactin esterase n=1 Tax=Legionella beliardensis TaxID=91822 RepID=A0A378I2I7_9GAMM|nr:alpha/beta hydrolase-fold protein [Legionella beliardensis]STX29203.1 Ferric enterobactin esterase [Legionella beliardensis]
MPKPIAYVYRKSPDNTNALGSLIPKDMVQEALDDDRLLYIQQPPSTETKPGLLILMDGKQEMDPGEIKSTPTILDELYENKKISPHITVYTPASEDRITEYACNEEFAYFLNNRLVPLLREPPFNCSDRREQTTIAGTSFGGLAATHAALTYPETFGNVLSQSGTFWWYKEWQRGFDEPDKWAVAVKTAACETTKKATEMAWLSNLPHKEGLPINFYLSE